MSSSGAAWASLALCFLLHLSMERRRREPPGKGQHFPCADSKKENWRMGQPAMEEIPLFQCLLAGGFLSLNTFAFAQFLPCSNP